MGINGLLPSLRSITRQVHISEYKGQRVAIDGYSWLHKGAYCCSRELCEGIYTDKFVYYILTRLDMLIKHGVTPILVFDGGRLPMKGAEEEGRRRSREENRAKADALARAGNATAALEYYQRCVDVTPAMAKQVIEACKDRGLQFLVAPYEADAQIAYLALQGAVQAVITEDSDLLAYGCPRVLFKMDKYGNGGEICLSDLPKTQELALGGFTPDMFLAMCILSGCDFLASPQGVGPKTAHAAIRKSRAWPKALRAMRFSGTSIPKDYDVGFQLAAWTFKHQRVFCPQRRTLVHLRELPPGGLAAADVEVPEAVPQDPAALAELAFLGPPLPDAVAAGIADGDLDPSTQRPFDLAAIYRGCTSRLSPRLTALLQQQQAPPPPPVACIGDLIANGAAARHPAPHRLPGLLPRAGGAAKAAGSSGGKKQLPAARARYGIAQYFAPAGGPPPAPAVLRAFVPPRALGTRAGSPDDAVHLSEQPAAKKARLMPGSAADRPAGGKGSGGGGSSTLKQLFATYPPYSGGGDGASQQQQQAPSRNASNPFQRFAKPAAALLLEQPHASAPGKAAAEVGAAQAATEPHCGSGSAAHSATLGPSQAWEHTQHSHPPASQATSSSLHSLSAAPSLPMPDGDHGLDEWGPLAQEMVEANDELERLGAAGRFRPRSALAALDPRPSASLCQRHGSWPGGSGSASGDPATAPHAGLTQQFAALRSSSQPLAGADVDVAGAAALPLQLRHMCVALQLQQSSGLAAGAEATPLLYRSLQGGGSQGEEEGEVAGAATVSPARPHALAVTASGPRTGQLQLSTGQPLPRRRPLGLLRPPPSSSAAAAGAAALGALPPWRKPASAYRAGYVAAMLGRGGASLQEDAMAMEEEAEGHAVEDEPYPVPFFDLCENDAVEREEAPALASGDGGDAAGPLTAAAAGGAYQRAAARALAAPGSLRHLSDADAAARRLRNPETSHGFEQQQQKEEADGGQELERQGSPAAAAPANDFHSLAHVAPFAALARKTLNALGSSSQSEHHRGVLLPLAQYAFCGGSRATTADGGGNRDGAAKAAAAAGALRAAAAGLKAKLERPQAHKRKAFFSPAGGRSPAGPFSALEPPATGNSGGSPLLDDVDCVPESPLVRDGRAFADDVGTSEPALAMELPARRPFQFAAPLGAATAKYIDNAKKAAAAPGGGSRQALLPKLANFSFQRKRK